MAASNMARAIVLEVERKFSALAVPVLTQHSGVPPFRSLQALPPRTICDTYYDRDGVLAAAGSWVRQRNGAWEAKVRRGGDYVNSQFAELRGTEAVRAHVRGLMGASGNDELQVLCALTTHRQAWCADGAFTIVLDTMDFGHVVGEVELQQTVPATATVGEQVQTTRELDARISAFMARYSWAFSADKPKGKLTAYFEQMHQA